jgi:hypothetical protein
MAGAQHSQTVAEQLLQVGDRADGITGLSPPSGEARRPPVLVDGPQGLWAAALRLC